MGLLRLLHVFTLGPTAVLGPCRMLGLSLSLCVRQAPSFRHPPPLCVLVTKKGVLQSPPDCLGATLTTGEN